MPINYGKEGEGFQDGFNANELERMNQLAKRYREMGFLHEDAVKEAKKVLQREQHKVLPQGKPTGDVEHLEKKFAEYVCVSQNTIEQMNSQMCAVIKKMNEMITKINELEKKKEGNGQLHKPGNGEALANKPENGEALVNKPAHQQPAPNPTIRTEPEQPTPNFPWFNSTPAACKAKKAPDTTNCNGTGKNIHPRTSNYTPDDVSIEKFFYFGKK